MLTFTLPPDVVLKILSFLPGKTLSKLRLVSKNFNSIISEPYFLRLHHRVALNSFNILTVITEFCGSLTVELKLVPGPYETALPASQEPSTKTFLGEKVRVLSSNNQFLCFVSDKEHFLINPINLKTLEIPKSSPSSYTSPNRVSFGYVSSTLQYKLIRFLLPYNPICKYEILTLSIKGRNYKHYLEISQWRSQEQECPYLLRPYPPVHADGFLYWTTEDIPTKIVSFSLEQEKFFVLPPPTCFEENPSHEFSLCGIKGNLWVVDYDSIEPNMEIWRMSDSTWIKTHCIDLKETFIRYYPSFPIKIHDIRCDGVIFQVLYPSPMKTYFTSKNKVKYLGEGKELQLCHYTDGLVSLNFYM